MNARVKTSWLAKPVKLRCKCDSDKPARFERLASDTSVPPPPQIPLISGKLTYSALMLPLPIRDETIPTVLRPTTPVG